MQVVFQGFNTSSLLQVEPIQLNNSLTSKQMHFNQNQDLFFGMSPSARRSKSPASSTSSSNSSKLPGLLKRMRNTISEDKKTLRQSQEMNKASFIEEKKKPSKITGLEYLTTSRRKSLTNLFLENKTFEQMEGYFKQTPHAKNTLGSNPSKKVIRDALHKLGLVRNTGNVRAQREAEGKYTYILKKDPITREASPEPSLGYPDGWSRIRSGQVQDRQGNQYTRRENRYTKNDTLETFQYGGKDSSGQEIWYRY